MRSDLHLSFKREYKPEKEKEKEKEKDEKDG